MPGKPPPERGARFAAGLRALDGAISVDDGSARTEQRSLAGRGGFLTSCPVLIGFRLARRATWIPKGLATHDQVMAKNSLDQATVQASWSGAEEPSVLVDQEGSVA